MSGSGAQASACLGRVPEPGSGQPETKRLGISRERAEAAAVQRPRRSPRRRQEAGRARAARTRHPRGRDGRRRGGWREVGT
ncbi:hypothetical protein TK49_02885 [Ralstonia mannitolilytica]|nr:hypothetical protein TK49_02885 [Ralstonia mannitolilytica]